MKKVSLIKMGFLLATSTYLMLMSDVALAADDDTICDGVFFEDQDIGGKTKEEAQSIIQNYQSDLQDKTLDIQVNSQTAEMALDKLGIQIEDKDYAEEAINIGNIGNLIQRYKDVSDAKNGKKVYKVELSYNDETLKSAIEKMSKQYGSEAKEPTLVPSGSTLEVKSGRDGVEVNVDETINVIKEKLKDWDKKDFSVEAKVEVTKPQISEDSLRECKDVLGNFSTNISPGDSNRDQNIMNATNKVNGTIVKPGDTFSILKKILPFTYKNGYADAGSYATENGQKVVKQSPGGGVCQVSTTLYNAVLDAELEVVARRCHTAKVTYVPPSCDAMISEGSDFKFKNNTDIPVYIRSSASGGQVRFTIYGKETRSSSRKVQYISNPSSYPQENVALDAELYKVVMENGKTTKTKINSSHYDPIDH